MFSLDESASEGEVGEFFAGLGDGSPDDIADEAASPDDAAFERSEAVSWRKNHVAHNCHNLKKICIKKILSVI